MKSVVANEKRMVGEPQQVHLFSPCRKTRYHYHTLVYEFKDISPNLYTTCAICTRGVDNISTAFMSSCPFSKEQLKLSCSQCVLGNLGDQVSKCNISEFKKSNCSSSFVCEMGLGIPTFLKKFFNFDFFN